MIMFPVNLILTNWRCWMHRMIMDHCSRIHKIEWLYCLQFLPFFFFFFSLFSFLCSTNERIVFLWKLISCCTFTLSNARGKQLDFSFFFFTFLLNLFEFIQRTLSNLLCRSPAAKLARVNSVFEILLEIFFF